MHTENTGGIIGEVIFILTSVTVTIHYYTYTEHLKVSLLLFVHTSFYFTSTIIQTLFDLH